MMRWASVIWKSNDILQSLTSVYHDVTCLIHWALKLWRQIYVFTPKPLHGDVTPPTYQVFSSFFRIKLYARKMLLRVKFLMDSFDLKFGTYPETFRRFLRRRQVEIINGWGFHNLFTRKEWKKSREMAYFINSIDETTTDMINKKKSKK